MKNLNITISALVQYMENDMLDNQIDVHVGLLCDGMCDIVSNLNCSYFLIDILN